MFRPQFVNILKNASFSKHLSARSGTVRCMSSADWVPKDPVTHTGQKWEKDDYRLARFIDRPKQVNMNTAIKLVDQTPVQKRKDRIVWCDGGGGPTGHPKVYYNLDKPGIHQCEYCSARFERDTHH